MALRSVRPQGSSEPYLSTTKIDPGEFIVELSDEVYVDVGVIGGALSWSRQRVHVPAGAARVDVDLTVPSDGGVGWLALEVEDDTGPVPMKSLRVRIADPASGTVLWDSRPRGAGVVVGSGTYDLPVGDYTLLVEGRPESGTETHMRAILDDGARLAL